MAVATITRRFSVFDKVASRSETITADGAVIKDPTLAAAKPGRLTTRTSGTVGTLTMESGHGIANAARLDIYWPAGRRYGVVVGTVAGLAVPFTGGNGDALPDDETDITAMVPQLEEFPISVAVVQIAGSETATDDCYEWSPSNNAPNPLELEELAAITGVYLSHGDSEASQEVYAIALVN